MKRRVETHGKPWGGLILILVLCVFGWRVDQVQATFDGYQGSASTPLPASSIQPQVEPDAGQWKTWLLTSGQQFRLPPPPKMRATQDELDTLRELAATRDAATFDLINYWNTGGPSYRWNEIARNLVVKYFGRDNGPNSRALALVHVAIYDAMIATWDSKYFHNRTRPGDFSPRLSTALPTPKSPSYPSEFAVAAGAASAVLSHLFPQDESFLNQQAEAAGMSRVLAGVEYPSDVAAGLELGRGVAALVIQYEIATGDIPNGGWTGTVPADPGLWKPAPGTIPAGVTAGGWKPWVLSSGNQLRPASPFPEKPQELAEVKNFPRTAFTNQAAYFWQNNGHPGAAYAYWNDQVSRKILEYALDDNPPRAARAYALQSVTFIDSLIACFDGKYAFWSRRPFQRDPTVTTLFPTPNHPSYPGAAATLSNGAAAILGYLFPREAGVFRTLAQEAANSRLWAGIHFRSDNEAGLALGEAVAELVIAHAREDGSE